MNQQQRLIPEPRESLPADDYLGLFPERVMPSSLAVLEQNGHLLFIRRLSVGSKVSPKQGQIFRQLVRTGDLPDAPGSITILCIWGLKGQRSRSIAVYDHMGIKERPATDEEIRTEIRTWWNLYKDGFR